MKLNDVNKTCLNLSNLIKLINWSIKLINLIKLVTVSHYTLFLRKYIKIGKDTFNSSVFLLLSKKNNLFCKLQLFPQNTDVLHYQRTIEEYNNL